MKNPSIFKSRTHDGELTASFEIRITQNNNKLATGEQKWRY